MYCVDISVQCSVRGDLGAPVSVQVRIKRMAGSGDTVFKIEGRRGGRRRTEEGVVMRTLCARCSRAHSGTQR